jgi:hypothetical protein
LLGGLDRMGLQPVAPDALGIGEVGLHRQDAAHPISAAFSTMKSVRAFLIGANSSHRSGGSGLRRRGLRRAGQHAAALARLGHLGAPFAVAPLNSASASPGPSRITANR